jgi:hypothetical protein
MQRKTTIKKRATTFFVNVKEFKYYGMGTVNTNYIHKEFMTRLYPRNVPYHVVQKILSTHLLPKN